MKVLFLSSGRRAEEIILALNKKNICVIPLIRASWFKTISGLLFSKYDIVHADNALYTGALAAIVATLRNKKSTCLIRGHGDHTQKNKRFSFFKEIILSLTERLSFRYLDHIFFISRNVQENITKNFKLNVPWSIAPNGALLAQTSSKFDIKKELREKFRINISEKAIIVISLTNLSFLEKAEGANILIDGFSRIKKDAYLIVAGDGKFFNKIKNAPKIIKIGFQKNVMDWLKNSDIFAYCSFLDGFPTVMLEAQAAGLPIVASNTCGIPETTKHAILCEPTPESFAKALKQLIKSRSIRSRQGKLNKNWIKQRNWNWAIQEYIKIWKQLKINRNHKCIWE